MNERVKIKTIPKFGGREKEKVQDTFQLIELSAEIGEYNEREKICLLMNSLEGAALKFFLETQNENVGSNWETIKKRFLRKFKKSDPILTYEITSSRQNDDESAHAYYKRVIELNSQLERPIDERTLIECIKMGVKDEVKDKIVLHDCTTKPKLENALSQLERVDEVKRECALQKTKDLELKIAQLQIDAMLNKMKTEKETEVQTQKESANVIGSANMSEHQEYGERRNQYRGEYRTPRYRKGNWQYPRRNAGGNYYDHDYYSYQQRYPPPHPSAQWYEQEPFPNTYDNRAYQKRGTPPNRGNWANRGHYENNYETRRNEYNDRGRNTRGRPKQCENCKRKRSKNVCDNNYKSTILDRFPSENW
jgi:hypothetical protein